MRLHSIRAAALLLPLLFALCTRVAIAQEDRYWEILTLFGGKGDDITRVQSMLYDEKRDHVIIVGGTEEADLPVTANAMKREFTDWMEGFIAVFNADCSELLYCSYIGGSENELVSEAVKLDDDRMLIALSTGSDDLPTTGTAWAAVRPGENNFWLGVLSLETFELLHAGYFVGSTDDRIDKLLLLNDNSIMITGATASTDLPVTPGAFQSSKRGASEELDAFIAIYDSTFQLQFCSYHGGADDSEDAHEGIAETENFLVFSGDVNSTDMPVTDNAWQKHASGGWGDAYFVVLSKDSLRLMYSTYLAGRKRDYIHDIVSIGNDRIALVGMTSSPDFPVTANAWQPALADDSTYLVGDVFLGIFSLDSMRFEELTFMGGVNYDFALSLVAEVASSEVSILLTSYSEAFPLLPPKPDEASSRGIMLTYNYELQRPTRAIPVVDVGRVSQGQMLLTESGHRYFYGRVSAGSKHPLPVRSTGHRTEHYWKTETMIGLILDAPLSVSPDTDLQPPSPTMHLFPQPATDRLQFTIEDTDEAVVTLYDVLGRALVESTFVGNGAGIHGQLDLSSVPPGIYIINVRNAQTTFRKKVLVQ
ncbi:MAG: T9SS type A sorting domain-containing protein [Bacteroidota bacterium]|nr:T9SS type A sorting domain-containing protein [Bacteroidota bacterium]